MIELAGLEISGIQQNKFRFAPAEMYHSMTGREDFEVDIFKDLGTYHQTYPKEGYPIGEGGSAVMFVRQDFEAALIDHSLCGFFRAPIPFIILDWFLLEIPSPLLQHHGTYQGDRIARWLDERGRWLKPDQTTPK